MGVRIGALVRVRACIRELLPRVGVRCACVMRAYVRGFGQLGGGGMGGMRGFSLVNTPSDFFSIFLEPCGMLTES